MKRSTKGRSRNKNLWRQNVEMKLRIRAGEKWSQSARVPLKGWTLLLVDNALEGRPHLVKVRSSRVLLASASGLARLFVPLLMDKSLASDFQLLPSFFRKSGRTMTCAWAAAGGRTFAAQNIAHAQPKTFDTNDTSAHFVWLMTEDWGLSPQSSVIKPQSSILILRSSILNPQSSVLNPHCFCIFWYSVPDTNF